jgi:hypothetical protein
MDQSRRASKRVAVAAAAKEEEGRTTRTATRTGPSAAYRDAQENGAGSGTASFAALRYGTTGRGSDRNRRLAALNGTSASGLYYPIDFSRWEMRSLLRYKRHFKLPIRPQASKQELVEAVMDHYRRPLTSQQQSSGRDGVLHDGGVAPTLTSTISTTEPDILAAFLHVTHRFLKTREKEKQLGQRS